MVTSRDALAGSEVIELTQGSADVSAPVDLYLVLAQVQTHHRAVFLHTANQPVKEDNRNPHQPVKEDNRNPHHRAVLLHTANKPSERGQ